MKIMVSACLLGINCKYDGGNNKNETVLKYVEGHEVVPVCPEELGGLLTPRIPCEIVNGIVKNRNGEIVDEQFRKGADIATQLAKDENVDLVILQSRSPSCGVNQIYDGTFSGKKISGKGIFAHKLSEAGIKTVDVEDL